MEAVAAELGNMANSTQPRVDSFVPKSLARLLERFWIGRRKAATATAAVFVVGLAYHVVFGANGLFVFQKKRLETRQLTRQMQDLQQENDLLRTRVQRLQTDPNAIEHQAREQLHYTRRGEVIYALPSK